MEPNHNNINGKQISFSQLLNEYSVNIPIIQRDYAQGRESQNEVREAFLNELHKSLNAKEPLNLDFVYGSFENTALIPLDGQQRLTTLFLLHWYLAIKENSFDNFKMIILDSYGNCKFTYETRTSSRDFCNCLVSNDIDLISFFANNNNGVLSSYIRNSPWFYLSWKNDPTIRSMLVMIDAIDDKFKDSKDYYIKLTDKDNPLITFQFLRLDDYKLSDDIYIKMNARGKLLTNFETFKAWLQKQVKINGFKITTSNWEIKLDVQWTDIFWDNKDAGKFEIDAEYYNFIKLMSLFFYIEQEESTIGKSMLIVNKNQANINELLNSIIIKYSTFESVLNEKGLNKTFNILTYFERSKYDNISIKLKSLFDFEENLLKMIFGSENINLNLWEKTYLYSFVLFLLEKDKNLSDYDENDITQLFRWLRITQYLVYNRVIDNPTTYVNAIIQLRALLQKIKLFGLDTYEYFASVEFDKSIFSGSQMEEENIKSKLILNDTLNNWEEEFIKYENHSYFFGQIGFLVDLSEVKESVYDFNLFKDYSQKSAILFGDSILINNEFLLERALLTKGNYIIRSSYNHSFCIPSYGTLRLREENWRRVFSGKQDIIKSLLDDIKTNDIASELQRIIKTYTNNIDDGLIPKDWRYYIIRNKQLIAYCKHRQIRMHNEDDVTLLSKTQMNGYHVELYTYSFYINYIENNKNRYNPFSMCYYIEMVGRENSYIRLTYMRQNVKYELNIYFINGLYEMSFYTQDNGGIIEADIITILTSLGFNFVVNKYSKEIPKHDEKALLDSIDTLCSKLKLL